MAHPGHLDLIYSGVVEWNQWRARRPEWSFDLSGEVFLLTELRGANFSGVNFTRANFSWASMEDKRWTEGLGGEKFAYPDADLSDTNLSKANLSNADLRGANLRRADLRGANLRGAALYGADFGEANLSM